MGGDTSAWGTELNTDLDSIDSTVHAVSVVANAALPAASYTAADVRTKLLTVDGQGSGVDADKLDGQQGSYYTNASNIASGQLPVGQLPTGALRYASSVSSARVTVSHSSPSGGSNGDLWFQY